MKLLRHRWPAIAIVAFMLFIALQPLQVHLYGRTIVDDGYYYLGYASNLAQGNGPTFDGLIETNGVQPVWSGILALLALVVPSHTGLIYAMLLFSLVLSLSAVAIFHQVLKGLFSGSVASAGAFFFLLFAANPRISQQGMETSINLLLFVLAIYFTLQVKPLDRRSCVTAGIFIGLTSLARVDNLVVTPGFAALFLYKYLPADSSEGGKLLRRAVEGVTLLALPSIVIFGTYLLGNRVWFGRWLPISGDAKAAYHTLARMDNNVDLIQRLGDSIAAIPVRLRIVGNYYFELFLASFGESTRFARAVVLIGFVSLTALTILGILRKKPATKLRFLSVRLVMTLAVITLSVVAHSGLLHFQLGDQYKFLNWYYVPEYVLLGVALTGFIDIMMRKIFRPGAVMRYSGFVVIGLSAFGMVTYYTELMRPPSANNLLALYDATAWINEHIPPTSVVGSFNSGIVGYFSDSTVINLDGLMNNGELLPYIEQRASLQPYLEKYNVAYLMDYATTRWSISASSFRGVPTENLEILYQREFTDWEGAPSVYYVFKFNHD